MWSHKAFNWMNLWLRYVICNTQKTVIPPFFLRFTTHSYNSHYVHYMHNNHQMKKLIQIYYNTYLFDTFSKIALTLEKNLKLAKRKSHCASKRKKENHQFQTMISKITLSYPNMTISYQFWLHISILVRIWLIESCSFYPKLSKNSIFT